MSCITIFLLPLVVSVCIFCCMVMVIEGKGPKWLCNIGIHDYQQFLQRNEGCFTTTTLRCSKCGKYESALDDPDRRDDYLRKQTYNQTYEEWRDLNQTKHPWRKMAYKISKNIAEVNRNTGEN